VLWQRFWLDLCTEQVVSAKAWANQFLPCSSSGIALFGMRTVQADSCLNSEQIDTRFISVGGQEGGWGGGGHFGPETQTLHVYVRNLFFLRLLAEHLLRYISEVLHTICKPTTRLLVNGV
jgi:hypothetical protein